MKKWKNETLTLTVFDIGDQWTRNLINYIAENYAVNEKDGCEDHNWMIAAKMKVEKIGE